MKPFLKWAGSKSRLMPRLRPLLPKADCHVVRPDVQRFTPSGYGCMTVF